VCDEAHKMSATVDAVQDGVILPNGSKRVISKHVHFIEIKEDGKAVNAGYAPYLDYQAVKEEEQTVIRSYLNNYCQVNYKITGKALTFAEKTLWEEYSTK